MALKRYSKNELESALTELTIEYLATDNKTYFLENVEKTGSSVPRILLNERLEKIKEIEDRVKDYQEKRELVESAEDKKVFTDCIEIIEHEKDIELNSSMSAQKELYAKEQNIFNSRTYFEFPLNKKINALYDDFNVIVLMYDDLCTVKGNKVDEFEALTTIEEKKQFIRDNIEITHIAMGSATSVSAQIAVLGKIDETYAKADSSNQEILSHEFSDFNKVSLKDTMKIKNNDLKQLIQSKIDIDKENLKIAHEEMIRGDLYRILQQGDTIFIRYVCPSTGRVYFNELNPNNLSRSEYYKQGDVKTYAKSWWSINNLGLSPVSDVEMIRC